jgi:beta-lactamase regulating signal transducer with metallopeptidase domain
VSAASILEALARASVHGALFIAAVWLVCRLAPRLPASLKCALWWAACLKLLVGLVWIEPVRLPVLPVAMMNVVGRVEPPPVRPDPTLQATAFDVDSPSPGEGVGRVRERGPGGEGPWREALAILWLAGLLTHLGLTAREFRRTRGVVRRSEPVRVGWITEMFTQLRARLGLRRSPELRGSEDVGTPQALGLLRPLVLVPRAGLERLSPAELSMTLCHELVHVRRRDLWLGWVPALAQRIFFFHPLAALAVREYALAREAACDAEVLRTLGSAPQAYGRLLLRLGVTPRETGLAAAGASPSLTTLKRRLQMLQQTSESPRRSMVWWWLAGAAVVAGLVPFRMVAQDDVPEPPEPPPAIEAPAAPEAPPAPLAPSAVPAPAPPAAPAALPAPGQPAPVAVPALPPAPGQPAPVAVPALPPAPPTPATAPVPPAREARMTPLPAPTPMAHPSPAAAPRPGYAPAARPGSPAPGVRQTPPPAPPAPKAPKAPAAPKPPRESGYSYWSGDDGRSWILLQGESNVTMSGSTRDLEKVKQLRKSNEAILWFREDGKEYVVRDPALLARIKELWKPVTELGQRQAKLGAEQAKLGGEQAKLGGQQAALGAKQAALGAQMAALSAELVGRDGDKEEYERRMADLGEKMEELGRQQEALGREQEKFSAPQQELGRQQEALGRQQEAASKKAEKEMTTLMANAIDSGAAQPVR